MARDPRYRQLVEAALDELEPGATFEYRRTLSEADLIAFCGAVGDYNSFHFDPDHAALAGFSGRIVPGLLTAALVTHIGGLLGILAREMHYEFLAPVYPGDTIHCRLTISERDRERRQVKTTAVLTNQDGTEVLHGSLSGPPTNVRLKR